MIRKPTSGNRTERRGRKDVLTIPIGKQASRQLRRLLGETYSQASASTLVEELIAARLRSVEDQELATAEGAEGIEP